MREGIANVRLARLGARSLSIAQCFSILEVGGAAVSCMQAITYYCYTIAILLK